MSDPPCWVVSDGNTHVVALDSRGGLVTHCRQRLPAETYRHDRLPSLRLCPECLAAYLIPIAALTRHAPAGRRLSGFVPPPGSRRQPVPERRERDEPPHRG